MKIFRVLVTLFHRNMLTPAENNTLLLKTRFFLAHPNALLLCHVLIWYSISRNCLAYLNFRFVVHLVEDGAPAVVSSTSAAAQFSGGQFDGRPFILREVLGAFFLLLPVVLDGKDSVPEQVVHVHHLQKQSDKLVTCRDSLRCTRALID